MKRTVLIAGLIAVLVPSIGHAQTGDVYVAGTVGGWTNRFTIGVLGGLVAGLNVDVRPRVGVEVDASLLAGPDALAVGFSTSGRLRLRRPQAQMPTPFISAGYTYLNCLYGAVRGWNVGLGVDRRVDDHRGFRIELRDVVRADFQSHSFAIRFGLTFR